MHLIDSRVPAPSAELRKSRVLAFDRAAGFQQFEGADVHRPGRAAAIVFVAADGRISKHRRLHGRRLIVVALGQGSGERRTCGQECHGMANLCWRSARNIE